MIILYLIGALGLGRFIVNALRLTWHRAEAWALVILLGYFVGAWALLLLCSLFGFQIGSIIAVILMLGAWTLQQTRRPIELHSFTTARQIAAWLITTGSLSVAISYLLYAQQLEPGPGGAYSDVGDGTDLPLHLSIITNVAFATHFTWHFSLMAGTYLTYPFLIDFLSGMITRWGGSLRLGLLLTSIPLCFVLVQLLFFLGYRAFKSVRAGAFLTAIFLLGGSSFGFLPSMIDYFRSHSHLRPFIANLPQDIVGNSFSDFNNFIDSLIPQRNFLFGLPVFCSVMILICQLNPEMTIRQRRRIFLLIGVITGLLPLAHVHSFFMIQAVLVTLALLDRKTASIREWLLSIVVGWAIAVPQLVYQLWSNHHVRFVHFAPGWQFHDGLFPHLSHDMGLFVYILANFGVILILAILSYRHLKGYGVVRYLILLGAAIFIAAFLFIFQPLDYDNIKFFFYAYLFFCLGVSYYLSQLSRAGKWQWVLLTLLLISSGPRSVMELAHRHRLLYSESTLAEVKELRRQLPVDALVLTSDNFEHPLWALAGQPVVEGQVNYLWTYGLPAHEVQKDVLAMYAGGDDALPLLRKYQVQYVFISRYERMRYHDVNEPFFERHFPLVFQRDGMSIYQVRRMS